MMNSLSGVKELLSKFSRLLMVSKHELRVSFDVHSITFAVPTFVTFLKDIESPFDVNDYVKSYLGESKESRDFAKQFLEKRSFYRNKAKKQSEVN